MKFGILLPVEGNVTKGTPDPKLALRVAEKAEEIGYDSVWAGERLLLSQRLDPISILSSVASRTNSVRLGTAVMIAPLKHPLILANQLATLDNISEGRVIAGFGVGADRIRIEYDSVGVSFQSRGSRLDECLGILKQAWSGQPIRCEGRHFRLKDIRMNLKPRQPNGIPIFLGGIKNSSLRRVAKYGDGYMPIEVSPGDYASALKEIASYQDGQKSIERALYITLNMGENKEKAGEEARTFLEVYYNTKFSSIEKMALVGTVGECVSRFEEYAKKRVETIVLRFANFRDQVLEVEQFRNLVASRF